MKRSKKYIAAKKKIEAKQYSADEALSLVKETSSTKFASSVELEVHLKLNQKQKSESIRGNIVFPHNFGKEVTVLAIVDPANAKAAKSADVSGGEELVAKIESGEIQFDVVIATPAMMPKIAKLGKTLGRKGLMPNPKNGTVTTDPEKTIEKFKSGQKSYKLLQDKKINIVLGKADMDAKKLVENYNAAIASITEATKKFGTNIIEKVQVKSTMGPAIQVVN